MQYSLDIYERQPDLLMTRLAQNCKARRLEKGLSRNTLAAKCGVPAPTIERRQVNPSGNQAELHIHRRRDGKQVHRCR